MEVFIFPSKKITYQLIPQPWVIDDPGYKSCLGYKIVHNPGYDYDLGYKNKSEFFHYLELNLLPVQVVHKRNCSTNA